MVINLIALSSIRLINRCERLCRLFTREAFTAALFHWTRTLPGKLVGESTLKQDVEVFLRTYAPARQGRAQWPKSLSTAR